MATGSVPAASKLKLPWAGNVDSVKLATLRALPGVVDVIVAADIPGPNECGPIVHDDPILAEGTVPEKVVAVAESIAFLIKINLEAMTNTGQTVKRIRVSGGL